jgi:hypothetical protein
VSAGVGGLLLILSLFIDWIGEGSFGLSGFKLFSIIDLFLLIVGGLAVAFAAIEAMGAQVNLPFDRTRVLTILGIISASIVWSLLFESDHIKFGFFLAAIGAGGILAGGILAERSPTLGVANPAAAGGPLDGLGSGGGFGGGGAPGAAPPAAAPPAAQPAPAAAQPQAAAPAAGGQPADWYPDPRGEKRLRYWDGSQWTDHTAD